VPPPFEQGEIGPDLFRAACNMGLEGLVSKRRDRPYRAGQSPHWNKGKNRKHPAMSRLMESISGDGLGQPDARRLRATHVGPDHFLCRNGLVGPLETIRGIYESKDR
jgi:hypothetical protein